MYNKVESSVPQSPKLCMKGRSNILSNEYYEEYTHKIYRKYVAYVSPN
jgi:hypothetical protein